MCPLVHLERCLHTLRISSGASPTWMDGWMDGWSEGRMDSINKKE